MASATVLLKEGKSYTYADGPNPITFREGQAVPVTGRELIDKLKTISCLAVEEHQDKPVTPLKAVAGKSARTTVAKPAPQPDPEPEETEVTDEGDETAEVTDEEPAADAEAVDDEPEAVVEAEPEPAKPAPKGGKFQAKGKKG